MDILRKKLGLEKHENITGTAYWDEKRKKEIFPILNTHGILENYTSVEFLEFLSGTEHCKEVLEYKKYLEENNIYGLSLDIDETLSDTGKFWYTELLENFGNPENLSVNEMRKKYFHTDLVPYWNENNEVKKWMDAYLCDNDLQKILDIIPGTLENYLHIHEQIIPIISYITARPAGIENGTKHWLEKHNFPQGKLILRPDTTDLKLGNLWKACVLDILSPNIVGIVDDNPNLIKLLPKRYPGHIFLFDKEHCEHDHINISVCPNVSEVRKNIENVFNTNFYGFSKKNS